MKKAERIGIIGSGASAIYVLQHLLTRLPELQSPIGSIQVFERDESPGMGMPYHPKTTDIHHLCNISSREIPLMVEPLVDWLRRQPTDRLDQWGIEKELIDEDALYPRLALGAYFQTQFEQLCRNLRQQGIHVEVTSGCEIVDVLHAPGATNVTLISSKKLEFNVERVFVCTGHCWPKKDVPSSGYFSSPWPIAKLLPQPGEFFGFDIGLIGASLSAFDVVTSLAHRHGRFAEHDGQLRFSLAPGAERFKLFLHTKAGRLSQLQFEQVRPLRKVYRHISCEDLLSLRNDEGWLRLQVYFNVVCRPRLAEAFRRDQRQEIAELLEDQQGYSIDDFVEQMTLEHDYDDPFEGMRQELLREKNRGERPLHWKEILDDLMYTLNFHIEMLPAEDHQKFTQVVMPFLLNVMAAMPLPSARILLALRDAGSIELVEGAVSEITRKDGETIVTVTRKDAEGSSESSETEHCYRLFVDCSGQDSTDLENYPFPSLVTQGRVRRAQADYASPAQAKKRSNLESDSRLGEIDGCPIYYTGGIDVDANYRVMDAEGRPNDRLLELSFPHTAGVRPYSYGLQACEETAARAVQSLISKND